jgi:hypothetical protein
MYNTDGDCLAGYKLCEDEIKRTQQPNSERLCTLATNDMEKICMNKKAFTNADHLYMHEKECYKPKDYCQMNPDATEIPEICTSENTIDKEGIQDTDSGSTTGEQTDNTNNDSSDT